MYLLVHITLKKLCNNRNFVIIVSLVMNHKPFCPISLNNNNNNNNDDDNNNNNNFNCSQSDLVAKIFRVLSKLHVSFEENFHS